VGAGGAMGCAAGPMGAELPVYRRGAEKNRREKRADAEKIFLRASR